MVMALAPDHKTEGLELVTLLNKMEDGSETIKKGSLAQFSDLLSKHGSLAAAVVGFIGKLVTGI